MADNNVHAGHRKRMKEQFVKEGFSSNTPDHKILEMLLFFSVPRKDTNVIAHDLIDSFGSFAGVFNASYEDLIKVRGVSAHTASLIRLIIPVCKRYMEDSAQIGTGFKTLEDVGEYISNKYLGEQNELALMLCLDSKNKTIACEVLGHGDISSVVISVRKVVELAIKNHSASVVLAHNHPQGFALPSQNDIKTTIQIQQALKYIGVKLYDHIIVANGDYVSLAQTAEYRSIFRHD